MEELERSGEVEALRIGSSVGGAWTAILWVALNVNRFISERVGIGVHYWS